MFAHSMTVFLCRAHRKLARYCHPDKVTQLGEEDAEKAQRAFEKLRCVVCVSVSSNSSVVRMVK